MAKSKPKKSRASKSRALVVSTPPAEVSLPAEPPGRVLEAIGVLVMLAALGLCFAVWSFDPRDRSGDENWLGEVGQNIAHTLFDTIGVVGYMGALLAVAVAGAVLVGRLRRPSLLSLLSGASLVAGVSVVAHLSGAEVMHRPAGGALGVVLGSFLGERVGPAGTGLVAVGAFALGLMGLANVSPSRAALALLHGTEHLFDATRQTLSIRFAAWRAARRAEREVEEAARVARVEPAALPPPAPRRSKRKAAWEEKRRVAIARAEEEAQERALARLAAEQRAQPTVEVESDAWEEAPEGPRIVIGSEDEDEPSDPPEAAPEIEEDTPPVVHASPPPAEAPLEPDVMCGADALALIAREEPEAPEAEVATETPSEAEPEVEPAEDAIAPAEPEPAHAEPSPPSEEAGPLIHERKLNEVSFDEEPEREPDRRSPVQEKRVYHLPPINLLDHNGENPDPVDPLELKERANRLEEKLETYGVKGKVTAIRPGPVVTTYEYQPAPGVKVSKIANLQDDIAMSMEAVRVRIVAPIPGRGVVGIELPNLKRENVYLKEVIAHERFRRSKSLLTLALGKDAEGDCQVRDLQKMPHLLVAGTTGSGKSVSMNTMILSMLYKATPEQVRFIMVDPKMLELSLYEDIPHLLLPVVTDPQKAALALQWAVDEMERRYQMLSDFKVRDLSGFNVKLERLRTQRTADEAREAAIADHEAAVAAAEAAGEAPPQAEFEFEDEGKGRIRDPWKGKNMPDALPYIVVLIDEFADLMTVAPRDVETSVQRLAQKARAAGIHVLLATQRPSTDVITGVIKNNFPSRIAFRVASRHDSATIINQPGAEALLGRGDSLMMDASSPTPYRIHGGFVSEEEAERVVEFWKEQGKPVYDESILQPRDDGTEGGFDMEDVDEHYDMAVRIVTETKRASISALQRRLRVGYNRAARMIEMMEMQGIVGPAVGAKGEREVLVHSMDADGPRA